jgi:hypothetical protein
MDEQHKQCKHTFVFVERFRVHHSVAMCDTQLFFLVTEGTVANVVFVAFACEANQLKVQRSVVYQKCRNFSKNLVYST